MNATLLLTALLGLLDRADKIGKLLQLAKSENRDVTDAELDAVVGDDNQAREILVAAIAYAKAQNSAG